jgi:hypothetical protein
MRNFESEIELLKSGFIHAFISDLLRISLFIGFVSIVLYMLYKAIWYFHGREDDEFEDEPVRRDWEHDDFDVIKTSQRSVRRKEIVKKIVAKDREFIDIENYKGTEGIVQQGKIRDSHSASSTLMGAIFFGFIAVIASFFVIFIVTSIFIFVIYSFLGISFIHLMEGLNQSFTR